MRAIEKWSCSFPSTAGMTEVLGSGDHQITVMFLYYLCFVTFTARNFCKYNIIHLCNDKYPAGSDQLSGTPALQNTFKCTVLMYMLGELQPLPCERPRGP